MGLKLDAFTATHMHNEGAEYEVLDNPRVRIEGKWFNGVLYRNAENVLCVRTLDNFNARFNAHSPEFFARHAAKKTT